VRRLAALLVLGAALWLAPGALAAGWCGTGQSATDRPDATTGQQIHPVVIVPADGADNFQAVANKLADDVNSMTAWWTGQDATRAPRFDQAVFPNGTCLDISFIRLPDTAASLLNASSGFSRVANDLVSVDFGSAFKKYLVYYDGPSVQTNICGTGGGVYANGPAYAIVWLSGCPDVPSDAVGMHELTHALGAVPHGAPHECPPPNDGHVCDSSVDLLYPFTSGKPLSQLLLDVNRDDYYGHSTGGIDIRNSLWLRHLDTPEVPLSVALVGVGRVTSYVPGLDCTATCATQWDQGTTVSLAAAPGDGLRFVRWTGACTGNSTCTIALAQAQSVTAVFGPSMIPLKVATTGRGSVRCTPVCSKAFRAGDPLTLRAVPAKGWSFTRWSGGCKGTRPVCRPVTESALTVRATFRRK
jgi:hypothetical protein